MLDELQRLQQNGVIFAPDVDSEFHYPRYAFIDHPGGGIVPGFAAIRFALRDKGVWQKAFWLESPNSYLSRQSPNTQLRLRHADVLRAAQLEAEGVQHG